MILCQPPSQGREGIQQISDIFLQRGKGGLFNLSFFLTMGRGLATFLIKTE